MLCTEFETQAIEIKQPIEVADADFVRTLSRSTFFDDEEDVVLLN